MEPSNQALVARVRAGGPIAGWAQHGVRRWVRAGLGIVASVIFFVVAWFSWGVGWVIATGCWLHCDSEPAPMTGTVVGALLVGAATSCSAAALWWGLADRRWPRTLIVIAFLGLVAAVPAAASLYVESQGVGR